MLKLNDETLSSIEFQEEWDRLNDLITKTSETENLKKMFTLGSIFAEEEEFWDLDSEYLYAFEKMENYPPKELFEDTSGNLMFSRLRQRCYFGKIFVQSESTPVLNHIIFDVYNNTDKLKDVLTEDLISTLNIHEIRILIEMINSFNKTDDYLSDQLLINALVIRIK